MAVRFKDNESWVREYLEAHPDASVDEIARQAANDSIAMNKPLIATVRLQVRQERAAPPEPEQEQAPEMRPHCSRCNENGHWVSQCSVIPEPIPVSEPAPEASLKKETPMVAPTRPVTAPASTESVNVGSTRTVEGTIFRRKRLNDIVEADPAIHPIEALVRLRNEFGVGLDTTYIYETCRLARLVHGIPLLVERDESQGRESPTPGEELPLTPDDELRWLATRLSEVIRAHNLAELKIRTEDGHLVWDYEIRVKKSGKHAL